MSEIEQADVVVVGMGPGGEDVAGKLAKAGLDVVGIEHDLVGGECPYWGCIPSKMMIRAADLLAESRRIAGVAGSSSDEPDWSPVANRIRDEATDDWNDRVAVERFEGKRGRFVRGKGRVVGPGRVAVVPIGEGEERVVEARRGIVVSTGTKVAVPPIAGLDQVPYWTNREAIEAKELPSSLIVLGVGAVGAELAQVYARFGVDVTVVEALDRLVPMEEPEAGQVLADVFTSEGMAVHTSAKVTDVSGDVDRVTLALEGGTSLSAAQLLVATGRRADLAAVGLAAVGIDESQRWVPVDEHMRVTHGVWAVGDITGKGPFTHVAYYQSDVAVADILGREHPPADYRALPRVTFTDPEIGSVGLTEAEARQAGINVRIGMAKVPQTARGWIHKTGNEGVIKLVEDADRGVLVGATTMSYAGGEVLGLLVLAVHEAVPTARLRQMMYAYPTFHKGVEDALRDLARSS
jgi:pyruvate/2-oxoglutarate dehydrogenase complex dihydrolipoamide dehydrogenase (E3) component